MGLDIVIPVLLGATVILSGWTALRLIVWTRAAQNVAGSFLLTAMACNLMGYLFQLLNNDKQVMLTWEKIQVIGLNLVYPALLIFILYFTGNGKRVTILLVFFLVCLSALPIVTFLLPSANMWFVRTLGIDSFGSLHTLRQEMGWVVWVSTTIAQVESLIGIVILFRLRRRVRPGYRFHMFTLYSSQAFAFVAIWMQISGFNPVDPISIFNLSFIPTCIAVSWAIYGLRIGQTLPLMRERVVETMHDGVIVLDGQNCAAYLNPSAHQMFHLSSGRLKNILLDQLAPELADHLSAIPSAEDCDETVGIGEMIYSLKRSIIEDWKGDLVGQVLVLRNVTDREHMEQALQTRAAELSRSNAFSQSLSLLAARVAVSTDLNQVYDTLRDELHHLDLEFCVGLRTPGQSGYSIAYLSLDNPIIRLLEKSIGKNVIGLRLPELGELTELNEIEEGGAIFVPRIMESVRLVFDQFPINFEQILLRITGVSLQISSLTFRLIAQDEDIGMLAMWGPALSREDLTPLSTFAAQVSAAIQKVRLIINEQNRIAELESLKFFNEGIVQGVTEAILIINSEGQIDFANPAAGKMVGVPINELVGKKWDQFVSSADGGKVRQWLSTPKANDAIGIELTILHQLGSTIPVLANIQKMNRKGLLESVLVSMMDIHQRIEAEQKILTSIKEKEALLKEIHHRVKNNLQIVTSLLNLQASRYKDQYMIEAFRESQNRVRSMALIHEKLYRSNNLARIRFDEYIQELGQFLMHTYNDPARRIQLEVKADAVNLDIDTAIPCGLIINELVTNSIKHGFPIAQESPSSKPARISIYLALLSKHQIKFTVADNGIGFPEDLDYQNSGSLGLQLVSSLTRQLGGEVAFKTNQGTQTEICFTSESAYLS